MMLMENDLLMAKKEEEKHPHEIFNLKDTPPTAKSEAVQLAPSPENLEDKFASERSEWKATILNMANKINDISKIGELQVELYSNRQTCLEHKHFLMSVLAKMQKDYRKKIGKKWDEYMTNHDRKMKMGETSVLVEASLANEKEKVELLEMQIDYFNETIKSIDNIIYGIRYRISVEEFRKQ